MWQTKAPDVAVDVISEHPEHKTGARCDRDHGRVLLPNNGAGNGDGIAPPQRDASALRASVGAPSR